MRPIIIPAGLHQQASFCHPAEVQTKLARAAAFDQIAADRYCSDVRLKKTGFVAGEKEKAR